MKTIVLGQGRNDRPALLDNPGGRLFSSSDEAVPTATKRVGGKTYFFGAWRGPTEGNRYELWRQASIAADDIVTLKDELIKSGFHSESGVTNELQKFAGAFLRDRTKTLRNVDKQIAEVSAKGQALYDLDDWDITSTYHDRLIRRWQNYDADSQKAMLRKGIEPDLIKALVSEPEFTSGIDDETRMELRESLLTDDEKQTNDEYRAELSALRAISKAYGTASELILEQARTTESALMEYLIIEDEPEPEPPPKEGIDSLATGGIFKLDIGDDDVEANAD